MLKILIHAKDGTKMTCLHIPFLAKGAAFSSLRILAISLLYLSAEEQADFSDESITGLS